MEKSVKEEQMLGRLGTSAKPEAPECISAISAGRCDHRLPHEIAAAILTAAYEVMAKKLAWDREAGR